MARDRVRDRFTFGGIKKVSLAWFDDRWEDTVRVQVRGTLLAGYGFFRLFISRLSQFQNIPPALNQWDPFVNHRSCQIL